MGIAEVLQEQRKLLGLTITEAARLGGIPRAYLSMIEAGKRAPSPQTIVRVMPALSIPTEAWLPAYLSEETRCQHLMRLAHLFFNEGAYDAARKVLGRAYFVSRNEQDGRYNTEIYHLLGRVYYEKGLYARAMRWYRLLDRATRHFPEPHMQGVATYNLALTLAKLGQRAEAIAKFSEADDSFVRLRQWFEVGCCSLWKANVLLTMHAYPEAHQAYRRAAYFLRRKNFYGDARLGEAITTGIIQGPEASLPLFKAIGESTGMDQLVRAKAWINLAASYRKLGRFEDAVQQVERGLQYKSEIPTSLVAAMLAEATLCYMLLGDRVSALHRLEEYKTVSGPKDSEDIAAMNVIAGVLGVTPSDDSIPSVIEVDYEQRLKAALQILQVFARPGGA